MRSIESILPSTRILYTLLLIFILSPSFAQFSGDTLQVDDIYSDQELVEDIFLKGYCRNISNVTLTGQSFSVGHFYNAQNILGIAEGILISTGDIATASGPNEDTRTSRSLGTSDDIDIRSIATSGVFDASGITFEFVPLANKVSFNYVFASEEYCEFVNSSFNDVFGFFVSGPGINGQFSNNAINVARIPGSEEFVSINTINHIENSDLYVKNELQADTDACLIEFDPRYIDNIEFDGFTVPLRAEFDVIPCETYRIRLIAADVQDQILDTGVFLEMNSFNIGGNARIIAQSDTSEEPIVSESCNDGVFIFERLQSDAQVADTLEFTINPSSTAEENIDFGQLPRSVIFLPGETRVELPVEIFADNEDEGQETLGLLLDLDCDCFDVEEATLLINDAGYFFVDFDTIAACADQEFYISPNIVGGAPPYNYSWNEMSDTDSIRVAISSSTDFEVTVTDFCGNEVTASTTVEIKNAPELTIAGNYEICNGLEATIPINFEGEAPFEFSYQIDNQEPITIPSINNNTYNIRTSVPGLYTLQSFRDRTCEGIVSGEAVVEDVNIEVTANLIAPECPNNANGSIEVDIIATSPTSSVIWTPDLGNVTNPTSLVAGLYGLKIVDGKGCTYENVFNLASQLSSSDENCNVLNIGLSDIFSPNLDGQNDAFIIVLNQDPTIRQVRSLSIFDRWGNIVFSKTNFSKEIQDVGFDGTYNGRKIQPSVLTYVLNLDMNDNTTRVVTGDLTLIR